jgi:hypothetical protein
MHDDPWRTVMAVKGKKNPLDEFLPAKPEAPEAPPVEETVHAEVQGRKEAEVAPPPAKKAVAVGITVEGKNYDATGLPLGAGVVASSVNPERVIVVLDGGLGKWKKVGGAPWFPMPR